MRGLAIALALLVIAPIAAGQGQGGRPDDAGPRDEDMDGLPDAWERRYFGNLSLNGTDDPDMDGRNNTVEHDEGTDPTRADDDRRQGARQDASAGPGRACKDSDDRRACSDAYCEEHGDHASCRSAERAERIEARADHVSYEVDPTGGLLNYTVDGVLLLERIAYSDNGTIEVQQHANRVRFVTDDAQLEIHDNPTGEFWYRSANTTLLLIFPSEANISTAVHGFRVTYPDRVVRIAGDDVSLTDEGITALGHVSFYTPKADEGPEDEATRDAVEQAKERRQIGASVRVAKAAPGSAAVEGLPEQASDVAKGPTAAQVTAFDDVEVNITDLPQRIRGRDMMRVVVSAELDSGRTIVLDVEPEVVGGQELIVQYFDLHDNGEETEVVIHRAGSLEDVLDANDDNGQPEYWVIEDESGVHVMVSVPHWSAHVIQISSLLQPSVLIGVFAGVAGAAVATVAMFWPRRREEW